MLSNEKAMNRVMATRAETAATGVDMAGASTDGDERRDHEHGQGDKGGNRKHRGRHGKISYECVVVR
jgi:hypothetical protein